MKRNNDIKKDVSKCKSAFDDISFLWKSQMVCDNFKGLPP